MVKRYFSTVDMFNDFFGDVYDDVFGHKFLKGKVVDTEKYDIIEKPEWKKKRLEEEIQKTKRLVSHSQSMIDFHAKQKEQYDKEVERLEKELKELE